ncbi:cell wall-binding repeat-containing protein [Paenibacillus sp. TRM 82003]|uniref:cell wall-binding repeat-containing protein n=1 Tax=Kineococcus sp. TRM81007 TaxID=2925831 RepID=UPI001F5A0EEF|nr:cell wall-binding repeat-containing protein [Kineococcus sp. TRM81007]MCI2239972.1 cell wall-binding repeat-containing protein [Kineococcus sp. TRM81007]MCI3925723.1 cell wall-binding repeat-containing protein [Paenibacillus sp. TRM 82003]
MGTTPQDGNRTGRRTALTAVTALALAAGGTVAASAASAAPATTGTTAGTVGAAAEVTPARAAGADRYATAAVAATEVTHPTGTGTAVIVTGEAFPDAVTAAPLAGQAGAALLLTPSDHPHEATARALDELGVQELIVLGAESAVSADVVAAYAEGTREVTRLGGADRYETAALVAREVARRGDVREFQGYPAAFLVSGEDFPDALATGAPAAAGTPVPVLLTRQGELPAASEQALRDLGTEHVWIVGGEDAVAPAVQDALTGARTGSARIAGADRWGTAVELAREFATTPVLDGGTVTLAHGGSHPDALVAGATAAATGGPVLLTVSADELGDAARGYLRAPSAPVEAVRAVGGEGVLSTALLDEAVSAAESGPTTPVPPTWSFTPGEVAVPAGEVADVTASALPDGPALPFELDLVLFPCDAVREQDGAWTFTDDDGDGLADRDATTSTGSASIAVVNGQDVVDADAVTTGALHGVVTFRLASAAADCAVPVLFDDTGSDDGWLAVDAHGRPLEPYAAGRVTFG